jgi:hypothetical protein
VIAPSGGSDPGRAAGPVPSAVRRGVQAFLVLAALAAGALPAGVRAARAADPPPAALQRLTRNDLIAQDPARFAAVYDSLLFRLLPDHPELAGGLLTGAQTYLEATGDSILLADHVFFVAPKPAATGTRR